MENARVEAIKVLEKCVLQQQEINRAIQSASKHDALSIESFKDVLWKFASLSDNDTQKVLKYLNRDGQVFVNSFVNLMQDAVKIASEHSAAVQKFNDLICRKA